MSPISPEQLLAAATAYREGTATSADVLLLLNSYRSAINKYVAILVGREVSPSGRPFSTDDAVRVFAYSFRRGGDVMKTLRWVVEQCRRYTKEELEAEVIRVFLECMREKGYARELPSRLAKNIAELIGMNLLETTLQASVDSSGESVVFYEGDDALEACEAPPCLAESLYDERGIVLTFRERELLRYMSESYNLSLAARRMGVTRQRAKALFDRLCKKARIV